MKSKVSSFAKINLSLKITGIRDDGYHLIDSIFQKISLADEIFFEDKNEGIEIRSEGEFRKIPTNHENTCYKVTKEMMKYAKGKRGIKLIIKKNIPQMAGLGGGSSNAASVLIYLNTHWNINFDEKKLIDIGSKIGADIPFFLYNHNCAKIAGIGEIITPCDAIYSGKYIALIKPKYIDINTKWAYGEFDKFFNIDKSNKFTNDLGFNFKNDFESVIFDYFPDLQKIKNHLINSGAIQANMTGSGSVIFGIFEDKLKAEKILEMIKDKGWGGIYEIL